MRPIKDILQPNLRQRFYEIATPSGLQDTALLNVKYNIPAHQIVTPTGERILQAAHSINVPEIVRLDSKGNPVPVKLTINNLISRLSSDPLSSTNNYEVAKELNSAIGKKVAELTNSAFNLNPNNITKSFLEHYKQTGLIKYGKAREAYAPVFGSLSVPFNREFYAGTFDVGSGDMPAYMSSYQAYMPMQTRSGKRAYGVMVNSLIEAPAAKDADGDRTMIQMIRMGESAKQAKLKYIPLDQPSTFLTGFKDQIPVEWGQADDLGLRGIEKDLRFISPLDFKSHYQVNKINRDFIESFKKVNNPTATIESALTEAFLGSTNIIGRVNNIYTARNTRLSHEAFAALSTDAQIELINNPWQRASFLAGHQVLKESDVMRKGIEGAVVWSKKNRGTAPEIAEISERWSEQAIMYYGRKHLRDLPDGARLKALSRFNYGDPYEMLMNIRFGIVAPGDIVDVADSPNYRAKLRVKNFSMSAPTMGRVSAIDHLKGIGLLKVNNLGFDESYAQTFTLQDVTGDRFSIGESLQTHTTKGVDLTERMMVGRISIPGIGIVPATDYFKVKNPELESILGVYDYKLKEHRLVGSMTGQFDKNNLKRLDKNVEGLLKEMSNVLDVDTDTLAWAIKNDTFQPYVTQYDLAKNPNMMRNLQGFLTDELTELGGKAVRLTTDSDGTRLSPGAVEFFKQSYTHVTGITSGEIEDFVPVVHTQLQGQAITPAFKVVGKNNLRVFKPTDSYTNYKRYITNLSQSFNSPTALTANFAIVQLNEQTLRDKILVEAKNQGLELSDSQITEFVQKLTTSFDPKNKTPDYVMQEFHFASNDFMERAHKTLHGSGLLSPAEQANINFTKLVDSKGLFKQEMNFSGINLYHVDMQGKQTPVDILLSAEGLLQRGSLPTALAATMETMSIDPTRLADIAAQATGGLEQSADDMLASLYQDTPKSKLIANMLVDGQSLNVDLTDFGLIPLGQTSVSQVVNSTETMTANLTKNGRSFADPATLSSFIGTLRNQLEADGIDNVDMVLGDILKEASLPNKAIKDVSTEAFPDLLKYYLNQEVKLGNVLLDPEHTTDLIKSTRQAIKHQATNSIHVASNIMGSKNIVTKATEQAIKKLL